MLVGNGADNASRKGAGQQNNSWLLQSRCCQTIHCLSRFRRGFTVMRSLQEGPDTPLFWNQAPKTRIRIVFWGLPSLLRYILDPNPKPECRDLGSRHRGDHVWVLLTLFQRVHHGVLVCLGMFRVECLGGFQE